MSDRKDNIEIAHIMWNFYNGGAERSVLNLASELRKKGIKQTIIICSDDKPGSFHSKAKSNNIHLISLRLKRQKSIIYKKDLIKQLPNYDIVHFHSPELIIALFLIIYKKSKLIYTHRSGQFDYDLKKRFIYFIWRFIIKYFFDGVYSISSSAQKSLAGKVFFPVKNKIIPNAVYCLDECLESQSTYPMINIKSDNLFKIGFVANIRKCKRLEFLILAINKIKDKDLIAIIVGDGKDLKYYKEMVNNLRLANKFLFTGFSDNVLYYYKMFDVFVMTSGKEEGFGNTLIEAINNEIPSIIFNDLESFRGIFKNNHDIFQVRNYHELSSRLLEIMENYELSKTVARRGKQKIHELFSLENMISSYIDAYLSIINKS